MSWCRWCPRRRGLGVLTRGDPVRLQKERGFNYLLSFYIVLLLITEDSVIAGGTDVLGASGRHEPTTRGRVAWTHPVFQASVVCV